MIQIEQGESGFKVSVVDPGAMDPKSVHYVGSFKELIATLEGLIDTSKPKIGRPRGSRTKKAEPTTQPTE